MKVEIWSDLVCPWCYLGKRRFEHALQRFEQRAQVQIEWRSYQLDAAAPAEHEGSLDGWLMRRYGFSAEQARAGHARLEALGKAEGIHYDFAGARVGNTRDAHRLVHLAATVGKAYAMQDRLMRGYFEERLPIGNRKALLAAALEVGLEPQQLDTLFETDRFEREVREDQAAAAKRGLSGVPAFVFGGTLVVSGAQATDAFSAALERAWALNPQKAEPEPGTGGDVCTPKRVIPDA